MTITADSQKRVVIPGDGFAFVQEVENHFLPHPRLDSDKEIEEGWPAAFIRNSAVAPCSRAAWAGKWQKIALARRENRLGLQQFQHAM
jgi:hypothetical protein